MYRAGVCGASVGGGHGAETSGQHGAKEEVPLAADIGAWQEACHVFEQAV